MSDDTEPKRKSLEERVSLIPSFTMTRRERNRLILVALAIFVVWWFLSHAWPALGPFIFGLVLAYLMLPVVDRIGKVIPRVLAILLVYLVFALAVTALGFWLIPLVTEQVRELIRDSPTYRQQIEAWSVDFREWYDSLPDDLRQNIERGAQGALGFVTDALGNIAQGAFGFITRAAGAIVGYLIIPFWLFYVLLDKEKGIRALNNMLPSGWRGDVWRSLRITNGILGSYIRGQLLLGLIVGVVSTIGLLIVGAPYPILLGVISGITELIPVIGPIIGAVPGLILAAFSPEGWVMVLKVLIVYVVVQQLENNLLVPKVQGDSVKVHPAFIMVALVIGSQVAGLFGLIVAVPVAAILRDVYLYLYRRFAEGYSPQDAEASVPSRSDEESARGKQEQARKLAMNAQRPGVNTSDEMIAHLDPTLQPGEVPAPVGLDDRNEIVEGEPPQAGAVRTGGKEE